MAARASTFSRNSRVAKSLPIAKKPRLIAKDNDVGGKFAGTYEGTGTPPLVFLKGINDAADLIELYALDASTPAQSDKRNSQSRTKVGCLQTIRNLTKYEDASKIPRALQEQEADFNPSKTKNSMIHPYSKLRMVWNIMMLLLLLSVLFILPVSIAFFYDDNGHTWLPYNIICDCLFVIDIVLNFKTGIPDENDVIMNQRKVAGIYARSWLIVDIISILPIDYIVQFGDINIANSTESSIRVVRLVKLLQLIRLLRLSRIIRYVGALQETFKVAAAVGSCLKMAVIAILVSHWSACIQFFIPAMMNFPGNSWVVCTNVKDAYWFDQYVNAWFKAISHQLGVGYGQCAAFNVTEIWVSILSMFIASTTWLILGAHTVDAMYGINTSRNLFSAHMQEVHEYMVAMRYPMSLREKIYDYYDSKYGQKIFDEEKIFGELSDSLKKEIIRHNSREVIQKTPLLASAGSNFVNDVVSVLKPQLYQAGDYIYRANTRGTCMYLLHRGIVEIQNAKGQVISHLKGGSFFGEVSLVTHGYRTANAKALTHCHLFEMQKMDFEKIFAEYPEMMKKLSRVANRRASILSNAAMETISEFNPKLSAT